MRADSRWKLDRNSPRLLPGRLVGSMPTQRIRDRLMAGHLALNQGIGVRPPVSEL